jgi:protein transport protein SEC24
VGLSANPAQIRDLFGVEDVGELDPRPVTPAVGPPCASCPRMLINFSCCQVQLPVLPTRFSAQIRNILAERQARRGGKSVRLLLARQNTDGTEIEVGDMLVEDENNAAMSYIDCGSSPLYQLLATER